MKTLAESFTKEQFHHVQVWREGMHAIYKRWKSDEAKAHWEAIRIKILPEREFNGTLIPEHEAYPSASEWGGVTAKTLGSYEKAMDVIREWKSRPEREQK